MFTKVISQLEAQLQSPCYITVMLYISHFSRLWVAMEHRPCSASACFLRTQAAPTFSKDGGWLLGHGVAPWKAIHEPFLATCFLVAIMVVTQLIINHQFLKQHFLRVFAIQLRLAASQCSNRVGPNQLMQNHKLTNTNNYNRVN